MVIGVKKSKKKRERKVSGHGEKGEGGMDSLGRDVQRGRQDDRVREKCRRK